MSRTKALLSHLPLSLFEGLWGSSRATASFSHLPLTLFARSCTKCGLKIAGARNAVFCRTKRVSEDGWGRFAARRLRGSLGCTGIMVGSAPQWNCRFRRRFAQLEPKKNDGCLARFHIFNFQVLREGKASFPHLQLSVFLREVSHESFVFTSSTCSFWGKSGKKKWDERSDVLTWDEEARSEHAKYQGRWKEGKWFLKKMKWQKWAEMRLAHVRRDVRWAEVTWCQTTQKN